MTSNIPSNFNKQYPGLSAMQSNSTYIPAMYQNSIDNYESKSKKTCRILKTVTSVFNTALLTAGLVVGGIFGFKWLKNSNLSFMSKPLEKVTFSDNSPKPEDIKGNDKQKAQLKNILERCKNEKNEDGTPKGCGVLLQGPPRCGKTLSANVFAKDSGLTTFSCKTSKIISSVRGETEKNIDKMFDQLRDQVKKDDKPVILIMDEIDSFLVERNNSSNEEKAMVNAFLRNCDNLESQGIIILGSTNYANKCDEAAIGSGRFNEKIAFRLPTKEEIENILYGKEIKETTTNNYEKNIRKIAKFMFDHNMNWADAHNILQNCMDNTNKIDYKKAMLYLISKCRGKSSIEISTLKKSSPKGIKWDNIYGLENEKTKLENWAKNPQTSSGYLLSGPAGCGKTTIPYALGEKIGADVYTLRIGDKGVNVDNVKEIIEEIKLEGLQRQINGEKPIILFMDEAEIIFPNREGADLMHSVENSHTKTGNMLDCIQNLQESGILCLAATNHSENVDGAIKRDGRLNEIKIGMPDKASIKKLIEHKYPSICKDTRYTVDSIANVFIDKAKGKSKLSIANIISVLNIWYTPSSSSDTSMSPLDTKKLQQLVDDKSASMNAKPLESGLTQIGKSLNEIKEAIDALNDEGASSQLARFTEMMDQHLQYLNKLNKLDNLDNIEGIKDSIQKIQEALGEVSTDESGKKHTLLNLIETMGAKLQCLENLSKLEELAESLKTYTEQNGEIVQAFNSTVEVLKTTMENINIIAENNVDLMNSYKELAGSVAGTLQQVKHSLDNLSGSQTSLADAIGKLNASQEAFTQAITKLDINPKDNSSNLISSINGITESIDKLKDTIKEVIKESYRAKLPEIFQTLEGNVFNGRPTLFHHSIDTESTRKKSILQLFCAPYNTQTTNNQNNQDNTDTLNSLATKIAYVILTNIHPTLQAHFTATFDVAKDKNITLEQFYSKNETLKRLQKKIDNDPDIQAISEMLENNPKIINAALDAICNFNDLYTNKPFEYDDEYYFSYSIEVSSYENIDYIIIKNGDNKECFKLRKETFDDTIKKGLKAIINHVFDTCWDGSFSGTNTKI